MSLIEHLAEDQLHHLPTSGIQGQESTKGLTINLGGSLSYDLSNALNLGLYLAAPLVSKAHVDGLDRTLVSGIFVSASW
jgi:hypothetical protein